MHAAKTPVPVKRRGRDIHEEHRVSTSLELLFDLTFVVAIAMAAVELHHGLVGHHLVQSLRAFGMVFFAIWWAWMNYSWFASAYDNDDTIFRLLTMLQMLGVLVLAIGIPAAFKENYSSMVGGYVIMRLALVVQWLRAGKGDPQRRRTCYRYALGITLVQVYWAASLALPSEWRWYGLMLGVILELCVPVLAELAGETPWHAHHIAERYGLMTIIVLGECVLGTSNSIASVLQTDGWSWRLAFVGLGGLGLVLALWWMYFLLPSAHALHEHRDRAWAWGYGHFWVYASVAALGAGFEVVAEALKSIGPVPVGSHEVSALQAIGCVAVPLAVFVLAVWLQWVWATRAPHRHSAIMLLCLACLGAVVGSVAMGLPLPWALPLLCIGPVLVIVYYEVGRRRYREFFQVH
jgi:low temperature requirement protein LtrA